MILKAKLFTSSHLKTFCPNSQIPHIIQLLERQIGGGGQLLKSSVFLIKQNFNNHQILNANQPSLPFGQVNNINLTTLIKCNNTSSSLSLSTQIYE
jgi:hypothetical protein